MPPAVDFDSPDALRERCALCMTVPHRIVSTASI
jgi:hypothetical protein